MLLLGRSQSPAFGAAGDHSTVEPELRRESRREGFQFRHRAAQTREPSELRPRPRLVDVGAHARRTEEAFDARRFNVQSCGDTIATPRDENIQHGNAYI